MRLANIKKYDYKKICKDLNLTYVREENPYIYVIDYLGFEHRITRTNLAMGCKLGIKSVDKKRLKEYFLKLVSIRHPEKCLKSTFEKFEYKMSLDYTIATCVKHGDYKTKPNWIMSRGHHCEICKDEGTGKRLKIDTKEFINRAMERHGDTYDYSKTEYKSAKEKVMITCRVHGDFQIVANYHSGDNCGCQLCGIESGGYSRTDYLRACPNGSYVYVMYLHNKTEGFTKVGISKEPIRRASGIQSESKYKATLIHTEFYEDAGVAWDVEKLLHKDFKEYSYTPTNKFGGSTECFDISIQDEVIKLLKTLA